MEVIGHHHPFIQNNIVSFLSSPEPFLSDHVTGGRQNYPVADRLAKQRFSISRAEGNMIEPILRIVIGLETNRSTVVSSRWFRQGIGSFFVHDALVCGARRAVHRPANAQTISSTALNTGEAALLTSLNLQHLLHN